MTIAAKSPTFFAVLTEAERLRRQAEEIPQLFLSRHGDLIGQPSAWCVVTERGWWARTYNSLADKDQLRKEIERGSKVILTIAIVAAPGSSLTATDHAAVFSVIGSPGRSPQSLTRIILRAKRYAVSALRG